MEPNNEPNNEPNIKPNTDPNIEPNIERNWFLAIFFVPKIFRPKIVLVTKFLDQKYLDLYSFGPNFFDQKQQAQ